MTETPKRRTDRLTPEQRAQVRAAVATWPPLTPEQKAKLAILFDREPPPEPPTA
ncbi:MAG: hypothetical protein WCD33_06675 [Mycobacterium sp.]|uniref:hypothetical protein n=1 Tax=Mycobacterium sp. TaxID=1785 RepID=UPI002BE9D642|nr:hypothetical protein [Mycobacterium sp.]HME76054.1 hypothetical protein [Mycobacterium sp.]